MTLPTALAEAFTRARALAATQAIPRAVPDPVDGELDELPAQGVTLGDVLDETELLEAWARVRANGGGAGLDGQSIAAFGHQALGHLQALQTEVRSGRYVSRPLQRVDLPKADGGTRPVSIPAVRDRVLQTAVARVLGARLEPTFDDASHAYRPGRSVITALGQLCRLRDAGLRHVLEADIEAFFDRIPTAALLKALRPHVADAHLLGLIEHLLTPVVAHQGGRFLATRGIPQGSPLSPLLANLALHPFDVGMRLAGHALVRYADDFVVLSDSAEGIDAAWTTARSLLQPLQLTLHPRKTRATHFNHGFRFLGVRFEGPTMQALTPGMAAMLPQLAAPGSADPGMRPGAPDGHAPEDGTEADADADGGANDSRHTLALLPEALVSTTPDGAAAARLLHTLHVGQAGSALRLDGERMVVMRPGEAAVSIPLGQVDQVSVTANVMVSSALLRHCAKRRISLYLADPRGGDEQATLDRGGQPDLDLWLAQKATAADAPRCLALARSLLEGKLHNSKVVLRRFARRSDAAAQAQVEAAVHAIDRAQAQIPMAADLSTLRGHEGHAARAHFEAMAALLPSSWTFDGRRRRPPTDPVNVLLSYGYAVLQANALSLVRLSGLNPHIGCLHAARAGGQALISDLIEAFRAPVVDAVVLTVLREGRMSPGHFETDAATGPDSLPCRLTRPGREIFVAALEAKFDAPFVHPRMGKATDMRRALQFQIAHWQRVVRQQDAAYLPLKFR